jgi:hypothetical protein
MRPYDPDDQHDPFQLVENAAGELVTWEELTPAEQAFYSEQRAADHRADVRIADVIDLATGATYADRDESWAGTDH